VCVFSHENVIEAKALHNDDLGGKGKGYDETRLTVGSVDALGPRTECREQSVYKGGVVAHIDVVDPQSFF
jgi:hypothetical protein